MFGELVVMKYIVKKVCCFFYDKVIVGFVGLVVDVFILFEKFEVKLNEYNGNLERVLVEFV